MKKEENGTEEIYLMPETETAEAVKPLAEMTTATKNTEKFVFTVFYTQVDKEVILSELKKMGAVIVRHSDKDGAVTAKMTMAQLAAIKTLECVERVEVAQTVKQSKKSLTNTETQAMLNTQQTYAATANASVSRSNTNNNGVPLLCYDDGGYSGGDCSNDISTAIHLPLSTWMNGGIHCPGAEMWYRFTASVSNAAAYSIYTTGSLDTVGYLYDANGDYITENDDNDGMNFCIASELSYGATYYICVRAYGSNTGDFSLRVDYTTESSSGNDSYGDGSNDMSTAIALPLSTYVSGSVDCPGTEMWYSFTASVSNAAEYSIYTTGDLDTVGYLYDSNGDYITDNDDSGGDLNFSITSELTYGATYYVCVSAYGGNTGSYDIRVDYETVSEEPDDNGYSNDMSSAINLSLNSWHSGEIYCPGAEMWYKFTPSTTAYYTLYTVGSLDTVGHIYDADCNQLDGDDDAGAGLNFKMVARLTAGHTYYVQVAAYADNTGYFSIAVTNTVFVEYVEIDQSYIDLDKGETVTLTAMVEPSYATNKTLRWETSDSSVATVNQSGVVTARGAGTACIRAYSQDGSDKSSCCEVWVDVPVQSVTINTTSLLMRVGEQEDLDAEICPTDAVNQLIRWTSTDTSVVWVNEATGQVEARGEGNATVYATAQDGTGVRGSCAIQVEPPIAVQGIDICCDNCTMNVGETAYLSYDIYPADATNQSVTWCSSETSVAEVDPITGLITAIRAGSATIIATTADGGFTAWCSVTVDQILTGADLYIDDEETRNLIVQYKKVNDYIQVAYLSGEIDDTQKNEQQGAVEEAINLARADYVILKPQSDFVYQFFQGRNHTNNDLCPFIRESYTYPNAGYNSSKDTLAITIIQRTLELLAYFEPPNEYVYGTYDIDTHNALLSSPFYMLDTNDFQKYSYYDMLGSTTTNERTKDNIKMLHEMRLFHNEVAAWVAEKVQPKSRTNNTTIYKNPEHTKWGFADVMKTAAVNEYIWEVKPWSQRYRVLNGMAAIQLSGYITAWNNNEIDQKYSPRLPALPGYHIGKFAFRSLLANKIIVVESNAAVAPDIRSGLVHYYPTKSDDEYQREFATVYALEEKPVTVPIPAYSYDFATPISFGDWRIEGVAQVAGAVVLVVAIGTVLYFCSPSLLPGVFSILAETGA